MAAMVLSRVVDDKRGLDGVLDSVQDRLGDMSAQDRALLRAILTVALRHRGEIEFALAKLLDRPIPKRARHLAHTLHVAAAQILFMDIPDSAAVDLAVTSIKEDERSARFSGLANAVLRGLSRQGEVLFDGKDANARALLNMPQWLGKRVRKAYGKDRLSAIASQHMVEPALDLTVPKDRDLWAERLGGVPVLSETVRLLRPGSLTEFPGYEEGAWWVQDAAATIPVTLLGDVSGQRVADLCAAPGGKTAQLAARGAHVTALEANANRLQRLKVNMQRLGFHVDARQGDLFEFQPDAPFDAILIDAPCSSLGTIRRHPDVQWTKDETIVAELAALQARMVRHAATMLKQGGRLVFANCSLDRAEGEDVAAALNREDNGLTLDPVLPDELPGLPEALTGLGTVRTLPSHLRISLRPKERPMRTGPFLRRGCLLRRPFHQGLNVTRPRNRSGTVSNRASNG